MTDVRMATDGMDSTIGDQAIRLGPPEEVYASLCANRQENSISCRGKYLLFSRCNCPVLYDLEHNRVAALLLAGHSDRVNSQHFVDETKASAEPHQTESIFIISTSHDRTAIIWQVSTSPGDHQAHRPAAIDYKPLFQFTAPNESSFTSSCSLRDPEGGDFITITTSIDCSICLWVNAELSYILETRYCCFEAKLFTLEPHDHHQAATFLFLACSDNKIRVFQVNRHNLDFLFELLGHTDWIKCLDTVRLGAASSSSQRLEFLLASASQDSYVRVWHMKLIDCDLDLSQQIRTQVSKPLQILASAPQIGAKKYRLTATLETVLSGHEGIVYGLCWFKKLQEPALQLISCSADKTIVVWQSSMAAAAAAGDGQGQKQQQQQLNRYDQNPASADVWRQLQRVGETGETNLPFLGVCLAEDESTFYAISLRGAIHSWSLISGETTPSISEPWQPRHAIMGHYEPITDLSWDRSGAYLMSASLDKTCRLHAVSSIDGRWHELARPQVHGHEINCLASIDPLRFATGAEEKTVRIFKATQFFLKNFQHLAAASRERLLRHLDEANLDQIMKGLPVHAQLPALGLSNKGAQSPYDIGGSSGDADKSGASSSWYVVSKLVEHLAQIDHLDALPIEEILLQSTLWVETHKLFGHANELHALAADSGGRLLASASKANRPELATVLLWDCAKFRKNTTIEHHSLTVTRLRFSPDDRYLLSVSRDRTWCLSERTGKPKPSYEKLIGSTKSNAIHERIIWDCSWTADSKYFMTVSRDKKAILWSVDYLREQAAAHPPDQFETVGSETFDSSIQAVDSPKCELVKEKESSRIGADDPPEACYLFAFGLENGTLELHLVCVDRARHLATSWQRLKSISNFHHLAIRRLTFRPPNVESSDGDGEGEESCEDGHDNQAKTSHLLASGSDDCIVKLTQFRLALVCRDS